jgi:Domain of unknown function (DUF5664)
MPKLYNHDGRTYELVPAPNTRVQCKGCAGADCKPLCQLVGDDCIAGAGGMQARPIKAPAPVPLKLTNPKQAMGDRKVPLHLVPFTAQVEESLAYAEGALKYGTANWRVAGVRATTYIAACLRHLQKYKDGENRDPDSRVHHLGNARACLGILLDAEACGKLNDDRPPAVDLTDKIAEAEAVLAHLKELHKDCNPKHYTELDKAPA